MLYNLECRLPTFNTAKIYFLISLLSNNWYQTDHFSRVSFCQFIITQSFGADINVGGSRGPNKVMLLAPRMIKTHLNKANLQELPHAACNLGQVPTMLRHELAHLGSLSSICRTKGAHSELHGPRLLLQTQWFVNEWMS